MAEVYDRGEEHAGHCIECDGDTTFWWGNGCMALCKECAAELTEREAYYTARSAQEERDPAVGTLPARPR